MGRELAKSWIAGNMAHVANGHVMEFAGLIHTFRSRFSRTPEFVASAPGRVNLIGEHTDYNEGFVLPAAIDKFVRLAAAPTGGDECVVYSELFDEQASFDLRELRSGYPGGFARYAAGVAWALSAESGAPVSGIQAVVGGDLPVGAGVSSSAAFEVAFAALWDSIDGLGYDPKRLAILARRAENEYVGLKCGIMDQLTASCGKRGHCLLVDTRSLDVRYVSMPPDLAIVVCDTGKGRGLTESAYNERWHQCHLAARRLGVAALRDVELEMLEQARDSMPETVYRRARHVVTENARVHRFVEALECSDRARIGMLMAESHASLRDDYEVSCPELDAMVEAAKSSPGCVGVRMTGAGFGGSCVALVDRIRVGEFVEMTRSAYSSRYTLQAAFLVCEASDGVVVERLSGA